MQFPKKLKYLGNGDLQETLNVQNATFRFEDLKNLTVLLQPTT